MSWTRSNRTPRTFLRAGYIRGVPDAGFNYLLESRRTFEKNLVVVIHRACLFEPLDVGSRLVPFLDGGV
jgi:hypothetical protein